MRELTSVVARTPPSSAVLVAMTSLPARERPGGTFDPMIAGLFADEAAELLGLDDDGSVWEETLASEPMSWLMLEAQRSTVRLRRWAILRIPPHGIS